MWWPWVYILQDHLSIATFFKWDDSQLQDVYWEAHREVHLQQTCFRLRNVEALVPLLMRALTRQYDITFWKVRAKSERVERSWTKHGKMAEQLLMSYTLRSLNWILQKFYTMYRNDWQLTRWNQNCDTPIHFGMPACRINDNHQILAESQHNFHFLLYFNS